jgi:hypothetical protein
MSPWPFPTQIAVSPERLHRDFWRWLHTRCPDPAFHFAVALPGNWRPVDLPAEPPTPDRPFVCLALFRSLLIPRAEIEVSAALLPRDVAPADWLDIYLENRSESVLRRREKDAAGGPVADILSRRRTGQGPILSRWMAIKDGAHLFVLQARVQEGGYAQVAAAFFRAVAGFTLLHPGDWPLAEPLKTYSRDQPGDFLLCYLASWELEQAALNGNLLIAHLTNPGGQGTAGKLTFTAVARAEESSAQSLADTYVESLMQAGLRADRLLLRPGPAVAAFEATWEAMGEANAGDVGMEVRVTVGQASDAWYLFGLLGPSRRTCADVWAVNKQALGMARDYFRTEPPAAEPS